MNINDKAVLVAKNYARLKEVHDEVVATGECKCGPECEMFHKEFKVKFAKTATVSDERVAGFLMGLGNSARLISQPD